MAFLGHVPNGQKLVVDHIDGDKLNNNLNNLQVITNRENTSKDRSGGTSKYVGVSWSKQNKKWKAQIRIDGKQIYIGHFTNDIDASQAYQKKLKEISN
jgi:alkyl hydroperoxide reductase subunit AhpF